MHIQSAYFGVDCIHYFAYHCANSVSGRDGGSQHKRGNSPPRSSGACRRNSFGRFCATRVRLLSELWWLSENTTCLRRSSSFTLSHLITIPRFIVSGRRKRHERLLWIFITDAKFISA